MKVANKHISGRLLIQHSHMESTYLQNSADVVTCRGKVGNAVKLKV